MLSDDTDRHEKVLFECRNLLGNNIIKQTPFNYKTIYTKSQNTQKLRQVSMKKKKRVYEIREDNRKEKRVRKCRKTERDKRERWRDIFG